MLAVNESKGREELNEKLELVSFFFRHFDTIVSAQSNAVSVNS